MRYERSCRSFLVSDLFWIFLSPPDRWDYDPDKEHDQQEQCDFPIPRDWRNRSDRYSKPDHASSDDGIIPSPDVPLPVAAEALFGGRVMAFYLQPYRSSFPNASMVA
jgi:hypothetical protein